MNPIDQTLDDRNSTHGDFRIQAGIVQRLKAVMHETGGWPMALQEDQREALDMIVGKISRILGGNPNHPDHWHDIAGYARLVERRLEPVCTPTSNAPTSFRINEKAPNG